MRRFSMPLALPAILLGVFLAGNLFAAPVVIYETGFEPEDVSGTSFSLGDLDGQGGWVAVGGPQVTNTQAEDGVQSVLMPADSSIQRDIAGTGKIWIVGNYRGDGSTADPNYEATPPAACIVHFSQTDGIQCLDGDGIGGGTFVPATSGFPVSNSAWTEVALHIVYDAPTPYWDCLVNGSAYQTSLGFRDALGALSGFKSLSGSESFFDSFRVIASDGDVDSDGFGDNFEIDHGTNPLDPASAPVDAFDVDGDGRVTVMDGILQYRIGKGTVPQTTETLVDVNNDGLFNEVDGLLIYFWATGDPRVPTLPVETINGD